MNPKHLLLLLITIASFVCVPSVQAVNKTLFCDCTVKVGFAPNANMQASDADHLFIQDAPALINARTNSNIFSFPTDGIIPRSTGFNEGELFGYKYANDAFNSIVSRGFVQYNSQGNYFINPNDLNSTKLYPFTLKPNDPFKDEAYIVGETSDEFVDKLNFQNSPVCMPIGLTDGYPSGGFARVGSTNTYVRYHMSCNDRYVEEATVDGGNTGGSATTPTVSPASSGTIGCRDGQDCVQLTNPLATTDIKIIIGNTIQVVMGIVGSITLIIFLYGGFLWLTSAGNSEAIQKGLQAMLWAGIGIIVVFSSYAIITLILNTLQQAP